MLTLWISSDPCNRAENLYISHRLREPFRISESVNPRMNKFSRQMEELIERATNADAALRKIEATPFLRKSSRDIGRPPKRSLRALEINRRRAFSSHFRVVEIPFASRTLQDPLRHEECNAQKDLEGSARCTIDRGRSRHWEISRSPVTNGAPLSSDNESLDAPREGRKENKENLAGVGSRSGLLQHPSIIRVALSLLCILRGSRGGGEGGVEVLAFGEHAVHAGMCLVTRCKAIRRCTLRCVVSRYVSICRRCDNVTANVSQILRFGFDSQSGESQRRDDQVLLPVFRNRARTRVRLSRSVALLL